MSKMSEKDLSCVVCLDIFRHPLVLQCGHSICKDCLQSWWSEKQVHLCPLCKELSLSGDPPCNLALKNLCEDFLLKRKQKAKGGFEPLCDLHSEKLRLFCLDHQELICLVCRDSRGHRNHSFIPVNEAAQDHKQQLLKSLEPLKERLGLFEQAKGEFDGLAKKEITEQFKKLHQFLQEEEEVRMAALREEEKLKSKVIMEKIVELSTQIAALSGTIGAIEEDMKAADVSFMQGYKNAKKQVQQCPLLDVPPPVSGALIDVAKHLGNLSYNIWAKMKDMVSYTPVILDPNTAEPHLYASENLSSVRFGQKQKLPDNPERIKRHICVLGSEGFNSGIHSWDVEVKNEEFWGLGVMKESAQRKSKIETGYWEVSLLHRRYAAVSPPRPDEVLHVTNLRRVRVQLDWNKGRLFFFDLDSKRLIHTFKQTFTEKMVPYICTKNDSGNVRMVIYSLCIAGWLQVYQPDSSRKRLTCD
uniref:Uncharacterized protein n=1 Tax=Kryptolebias marmoratus TaxID=37003 RepID=A0A3Q3B793_KRYMA